MWGCLNYLNFAFTTENCVLIIVFMIAQQQPISKVNTTYLPNDGNLKDRGGKPNPNHFQNNFQNPNPNP